MSVRYRAVGEDAPDVDSGAVLIWYAADDEIAGLARHPEGRGALSESDRARWERLAMEDDRERFLAARIILRFMLCAATGVSPEQWRFESDEHGRPFVAAPTSHTALRFSITHTAGLVACAVTGFGDVGIDAEARDRRSRTMDVARRFFAPAEVACLEARSAQERRDAFFAIWTLKEAYVKAMGRGLTLPLDRFSFDLSAPPPAVPFQTELGDPGDEWAFALERPTPGHFLAVAVRGGRAPHVDVHVRRVTCDDLHSDRRSP